MKKTTETMLNAYDELVTKYDALYDRLANLQYELKATYKKYIHLKQFWNDILAIESEVMQVKSDIEQCISISKDREKEVSKRDEGNEAYDRSHNCYVAMFNAVMNSIVSVFEDIDRANRVMDQFNPSPVMFIGHKEDSGV
jgi:hypothetical protein